jgi:hypothetical protein
MRIRDGRYECAYCGAVLEIPLSERPRVVIRAASGKPNVRGLELEGRLIHSCEIAPLGGSASMRRQRAAF